MTPEELMLESLVVAINVGAQARDNLFSANHRGAMIRKYGYSDAMSITVGELSGEV